MAKNHKKREKKGRSIKREVDNKAEIHTELKGKVRGRGGKSDENNMNLI